MISTCTGVHMNGLLRNRQADALMGMFRTNRAAHAAGPAEYRRQPLRAARDQCRDHHYIQNRNYYKATKVCKMSAITQGPRMACRHYQYCWQTGTTATPPSRAHHTPMFSYSYGCNQCSTYPKKICPCGMHVCCGASSLVQQRCCAYNIHKILLGGPLCILVLAAGKLCRSPC